MSKISFHEMQFPSDIAYGATGGPEFFTDVITSSSGFEQRSINWFQARNRYNLAPAIKNKQQLEILLSFFYSCKGKAVGFRFKDWSDYKINKQKIAVANGDTKEFQLIKIYEVSGFKSYRKITKPVFNKVKIYSDDQLVKPDIDYTTGKISFLEAPLKDTVIKAEAEFDVPVRFDNDQLITSIENYGAYSHQEIPLIEIKI